MLSFVGFLLSLGPVNGAKSDAEIVVEIRKGSDAAFRLLFDRHHPALYRFLVRLGVPREAAEDLLQDVFLAAWARRARLDPAQSIRAYLFRACKNRAANHFRNRAKLVDVIPDEPVHLGPLPDEHVEYALLQHHLSEAISSLPDRRRAVFELCFIEGLAYKEAAEALGLSRKTVENQMGYALKAIRKHLAPFLEEVD